MFVNTLIIYQQILPIAKYLKNIGNCLKTTLLEWRQDFYSQNVTSRELTLFSNFLDIKKTKWRCIYFLRKCHWGILTWSHNTLNFLSQVNLYIFLKMTNYIFLMAQYNKVYYKFIQTFIHSICSCVYTCMAHLWLSQQSIELDSCILFSIFPINSNNTSSYGDHCMCEVKRFSFVIWPLL